MESSLELFDEQQLPAGHELLMPEEKQRHVFTLERVLRNRERTAGIVAALGEGFGVNRICRAYRVSPHVVLELREREPGWVASEREAAKKIARRIVRMSGEALLEALEQGKIAPGQLPVTWAIAVDKLAALEGQPSQVIEIRREVDAEAIKRGFAAMLERAEAARLAERRPATEIEVEVSAPDSVSGGNARLCAGFGGESCAGVVDGVDSEPSGTDFGDQAGGLGGNGGEATTAALESSEGGGGGVGKGRGGAETLMGWPGEILISKHGFRSTS